MDEGAPRGRSLWVVVSGISAVLTILVVGYYRHNPSASRDSSALPLALPEVPKTPAVEKTGGAQVNPPGDEALEELAAGVGDLPLPEDMAVWERWYNPEGKYRSIEDAGIIWQKTQHDYVDFLRQETFAQGAYRTYMVSELLDVMANEWNCRPHYHRIIRIFARTRRYSKLLAQVAGAKAAGGLDAVLETLDDTVGRFLSERRRVEEAILQLIDEEPELFRPGAPESERSRLVDLFQGFGTFPYDLPEGVVPMSVDGTALGIVANTFLLGVTEDRRAMGTVLEIAQYDSDAFVDKVCAAFGSDTRRRHYYLANMPVLADACDRILQASSSRDTLGPEARAVAREYVQWRFARDFPAREVVQVFLYDAAQTPYHLPGMITGWDPKTGSFPLELPIEPSREGRPGLTEADIAIVVDYAERFQKAGQGR